MYAVYISTLFHRCFVGVWNGCISVIRNVLLINIFHSKRNRYLSNETRLMHKSSLCCDATVHTQILDDFGFGYDFFFGFFTCNVFDFLLSADIKRISHHLAYNDVHHNTKTLHFIHMCPKYKRKTYSLIDCRTTRLSLLSQTLFIINLLMYFSCLPFISEFQVTRNRTYSRALDGQPMSIQWSGNVPNA